jgi:hypothetical protein
MMRSLPCTALYSIADGATYRAVRAEAEDMAERQREMDVRIEHYEYNAALKRAYRMNRLNELLREYDITKEDFYEMILAQHSNGETRTTEAAETA